MEYPRWSGKYADMIFIQSDPEIEDISGITESWLDRSQHPFINMAAELLSLKLEPTNEFKTDNEGNVAEVWRLSKN